MTGVLGVDGQAGESEEPGYAGDHQEAAAGDGRDGAHRASEGGAESREHADATVPRARGSRAREEPDGHPASRLDGAFGRLRLPRSNAPRRLGVDRVDRGRATSAVRVVLDLRPLQEAERAPTTAAYLEQLLAAFEADPVEGESFVALLRLGRPDPTTRFRGLPVAGRRWLPPTRLLRSTALTLDPFLLRGISIAAAPRHGAGEDRLSPAGAVFHTAAGAAPLASGLPVVATLLDVAPWELPNAYQASPASRFGQRLRSRILRDAAAVIVGATATARSTRRLLHVPAERLHVVPLAAAPEFRPNVRLDTGETFTGSPRQLRHGRGVDPTGIEVLGPDPGMVDLLEHERAWLGLGERYLVFFGRYDARKDMATLIAALAQLRSTPRPTILDDGVPWPPRLLLVNASPDDRAALARAAAREGVGDLLVYAPFLEIHRLAAVVAGARAAVLPAVSEGTALPAIEALAAGTPVVASAVGALPEVVGSAGILVEPRDPARLATALLTIWADDAVHARLLRLARAGAIARRRTWADVARETRAVYAAAAGATATAGGGRAEDAED